MIENYIYYQFKLFGIKLMSPVKYCLFVLLSLSMSQNNEGYVFKHSIDDQYYDIENIVEQHFGPWDIMINFSGRYKRKLVGIDEKTGEFTTLQHWEGVIANTRVDDKVEPNHDVQRFNESSYIELWDSAGNMLSKTPRDDLSREIMEDQQQDEIGSLFTDENNLLYPLGDSVRFEGDVWTIEEEEEVDSFPGLDFFEGTKKETSTYTFKKVRVKRGDKIAYINVSMQIELHGVGTTWEKTLEFSQILTGTCKVQFNIDKGIIKKSDISMSAVGEGKDLENDTIRKYTVNMMIESKGKLQ